MASHTTRLQALYERLDVYDGGERLFLSLGFNAGVLNEQNAGPLLEAHREGSGLTHDLIIGRGSKTERQTKKAGPGNRTTASEPLPPNIRDLDELRARVVARQIARVADASPE